MVVRDGGFHWQVMHELAEGSIGSVSIVAYGLISVGYYGLFFLELYIVPYEV